MKDSSQWISLALLMVFSSSLLLGCVPATYRTHPEFESRVNAIRNPGMLPPDVKVYELTAGGLQDLRDDWCHTGKENVLKALDAEFKQRSFQIIPLPPDKEIEDELEDIQALYRAVSLSIQLHTYNEAFIFPEKVKKFDYSVGPVDKILARYGADALIFVYGFDEVSSSGRKALAAAGIVLGVFTGVVIIPRSGVTAVSLALVDSSGSILWYNLKTSQGGHNLTEYDSASSIMSTAVTEFPLLSK